MWANEAGISHQVRRWNLAHASNFATGSATASCVTFSRPACDELVDRSDSTASARSTSRSALLATAGPPDSRAQLPGQPPSAPPQAERATWPPPAASPQIPVPFSPKLHYCTVSVRSEMNMRRASSRTSSPRCTLLNKLLMRASNRIWLPPRYRSNLRRGT